MGALSLEQSVRPKIKPAEITLGGLIKWGLDLWDAD